MLFRWLCARTTTCAPQTTWRSFESPASTSSPTCTSATTRTFSARSSRTPSVLPSKQRSRASDFDACVRPLPFRRYWKRFAPTLFSLYYTKITKISAGRAPFSRHKSLLFFNRCYFYLFFQLFTLFSSRVHFPHTMLPGAFAYSSACCGR